MEFYLILGNTKAMVFIWEGGGGGGFTTKRKRGKEYRTQVVKCVELNLANLFQNKAITVAEDLNLMP